MTMTTTMVLVRDLARELKLCARQRSGTRPNARYPDLPPTCRKAKAGANYRRTSPRPTRRKSGRTTRIGSHDRRTETRLFVDSDADVDDEGRNGAMPAVRPCGVVASRGGGGVRREREPGGMASQPHAAGLSIRRFDDPPTRKSCHSHRTGATARCCRLGSIGRHRRAVGRAAADWGALSRCLTRGTPRSGCSGK